MTTRSTTRTEKARRELSPDEEPIETINREATDTGYRCWHDDGTGGRDAIREISPLEWDRAKDGGIILGEDDQPDGTRVTIFQPGVEAPTRVREVVAR